MSDEKWGLVLAFPDESPSFGHGFEAGGIWRRMRSGTEDEIELTTHAANREILQRMATSEGWQLETRESEVEGWDYTTLRKVMDAKHNPHGLRVVQ